MQGRRSPTSARSALALALALAVALVGTVSLVSSTRSIGTTRPAPQSTSAPPAAGTAGTEVPRLPVRFEANRGQSDPRVRFTARAGGSTLFLTPTEMVFSVLPAPAKGAAETTMKASVVRMRLTDADGASVEGRGALPGVSNYFVGADRSRWATSVPGYAEVRYSGIRPGIDLVVHGRSGALEYDYEVAPGARPSDVGLDVSGADGISVDESGDLVLRVAGGEVRHRRPIAYQEVDGIRVPVPAEFALSESRVGFSVGAYDPARPLVIDPTLAYSTFLGGTGDDEGRAVAVDATGAAYVTGRTASPDFPTSPAQAENPGSVAFVSKLSPDGTALVYSSYFGGTGGDSGNGIAVRDGSAYVTGTTSSTDFPTTPGALSRGCGTDGSCSGGPDAFVTTFAPDGSIAYSTYVGGRGEDNGNAITVDAGGRAYVTGATRSASFPTTAGSLSPRCGSDGACYANATFTDGVSTDGDTTFTSASAGFTADDVGKEITGTNIAVSTTIAAVVDAATVTLSQPASGSGTGLTFSIANATFTDGASTDGSTTYTSALPHFMASDVGHGISGDNIAEGTTVAAFVDPTTVTLSQPATATGSRLTFTIARSTFTDGVSAIGTPHYTSASAAFTGADEGLPISGDNIPDGTTVAYVFDATIIGLSADPTASGSGLTFTIDRNTFPDSGFAFSGTTTFYNFRRSFRASDVGKGISGDNIAPGTTITALAASDGFAVTLSQPATGTGRGTFSIARDTSADGVSTAASTTFTSATGNFTAADVGKGISGTNIPAGTTIAAVTDATTVTLSNPATDSGTGLTFTVARNTFSDGVSTTASPPFTSASADFAESDVGRAITADTLHQGTTIASVNDATSVQLAPNAAATGSGLTFTIDRGRPVGGPRQFAFLVAVDPDGGSGADLAYGTYLGGVGDSSGAGIAMLGTDPVVVGTTSAPDLPVADPFQTAFAGEQDAFVAHLSTGGAGAADLVSSTFLGGSASDAATAVAAGAGGIFVTGSTSSSDFPMESAFDGTFCADPCNGGNDAFVTKLAADGSALAYSSYLGGGAGGAEDVGRAIAVDAGGAAYVAGSTGSSDFPVVHPVLYRAGEQSNAFVTKVVPDGSALDYSTYLGGSGNDQASGIGLTSSGNAIVVGTTSPSGQFAPADFPTTAGAFDRVCGSTGTCDPFGAPDAFVTRLGPGDLAAVRSVAPRGGPVTVATSVLITGDGFTGATAVRFGDMAASFTVLSDSLIRASSPITETPALVPVTVTNSAGTSLLSSVSVYRYGEGLFSPTAACTIAECGHGAVLLANGKVLVALGEGDREAELFDPVTGTWSRTGSCADLPGADGPQGCGRGFPGMAMTLLSGPPAACGSNCGKVLVSGGYGPVNAPGAPNRKAAFLYDPSTGSWTRTADMNVARVNHSATLLPDGTVLVAGGCRLRPSGCGPSGGLADTTAELYHPDTGTWTFTNSMNAGRAVFPAVLLDPVVSPCFDLCGKVLVVGGVSNGSQQDGVEAYDPVTRTWSVQAPLGVGRYANPAIQVPGASVVAIGSYGQSAVSSEFYDLAAQEWAPTGPMARSSDSEGDAVRLPNGKVLSIAGGRDVQLYDGPSHGWTATGPRGHDYAHTQEVLLPPGPSSACGTNCGKVLIAGSTESGESAAELYTPRPQVSGVAPATAATGGGSTVTITGTGLTTVSSVRFGDAVGTNLSHDPETPDTKLTVTVPAHAAGAVDVTATGPAGRSPVTASGVLTYAVDVVTTTPTTGSTGTTSTTTAPGTGPGAPGAGGALGGQGYSLVASDGGVFAFGTAPFLGSTGSLTLSQPVVAMERTASGRGYWLVAADGGVFAFGDARFLGSTGGIRLARPIVGMRATPSGNGYWLVASDGGVFAFGDAVFRGSTGALKLNSPVVAVERTAAGDGYWLVAADGGVFAFGGARFFGSTGAIRLARPIVGAVRSGSGAGYLLVGADGGVFAFGDAAFRGSAGALRLNQPVVGLASTADGAGYWLCARDGGVFAFGNAQFRGSMGGAALNQTVVACSGP